MANYEINEEQEVLTKAMRMIETGDPVHADIYNALFSALLNNDVFLEKLANKMVQQAMVSHVMDSTNSNMVLGADQGPVITKLIDKVQEQVTVLNTKKAERLDLVRISSSQPQYVECLNCLVLIISANASCFDLYSCIGYQSDSIRSVITHIAGKGRSKIEYAAEGSTFCGQGKYKVINENSINEAVVYRIRLT